MDSPDLAHFTYRDEITDVCIINELRILHHQRRFAERIRINLIMNPMFLLSHRSVLPPTPSWDHWANQPYQIIKEMLGSRGTKGELHPMARIFREKIGAIHLAQGFGDVADVLFEEHSQGVVEDFRVRYGGRLGHTNAIDRTRERMSNRTVARHVRAPTT